jgi:hypothetical protein
MHLRKLLFAVLALAAAAAILTPEAARACSMCRCSDPVFNALGQGVYTNVGFHVAVDWLRQDQSQGEGEDFEHQIRNSLTLTASYSWKERLLFVAQVPYVWAHQTGADGVEDAHDFGDPTFYVYGRLWASEFSGGLGRRAWLSAIFSVKTPWGENDAEEDGERLDEHVQPGTGATNLAGGLSFLYLFDADSSIYFSSLYTGTGRNGVGYKYGNNVQVNAVYDRRLTDWLDALFEVNFLYAKRDQFDRLGLEDPNTGGNSLYLTPRIAVNVVKGLVARASAQFPVWKDLNGVQEIKPTYSAGLTWVF